MNTRTQISLNQSQMASSWSIILSLIVLMISSQQYLLNHEINELLGRLQTDQNQAESSGLGLVMLAEGHIVLTRDDRGSSLVLTGEDGKGGGKGGKGGGEDDQLVIAGDNGGGGGGGGGRNTNMIVQDASNREGDVVINGNSMIVPGEDGHIVLADGRSQGNERSQQPSPPPNLFAFWLPYMNSRMSYRMAPFFGGQFG